MKNKDKQQSFVKTLNILYMLKNLKIKSSIKTIDKFFKKHLNELVESFKNGPL